MKEKYLNIYEYLNQEYSYHDIDVVIYDAAIHLLDYLKSNETFQLYNNRMNSKQDVYQLFEELANNWIDDNYLIITEDEQSMRNYNILTDRNTNKVIKDDVFRLLRQNI